MLLLLRCHYFAFASIFRCYLIAIVTIARYFSPLLRLIFAIIDATIISWLCFIAIAAITYHCHTPVRQLATLLRAIIYADAAISQITPRQRRFC